MPAFYAHYQFGKKVSSMLMNTHLKELIANYYNQFSIGLQGPDIFFFYKPYRASEVAQYGHQMHDESALPFFIQAKKIIQQYGRDSIQYAYLLGFMCHYILDSECHPYVEAMVEITKVDHIEIEEEFEKKLLRRDALDPFAFPIYRLVPTDDSTVEAMLPFFKERTRKEIHDTLCDLRRIKKLLHTPGMVKYTCLNSAMKISGKYASLKGLMHQRLDNIRCVKSNEGLLERYEKAVLVALEQIVYFDDCVIHDTIISDRMKKTFG